MVLTLREEASKNRTISTMEGGHNTFIDNVMKDLESPRFVATQSRSMHRRWRSTTSEDFATDFEDGEAYAMSTQNRAESRQAGVQATRI